MMRYLKLSSILLLLLAAACSNPYKKLQLTEKSGRTAFAYKPQFNKELYRCVVDGKVLFKKFHLSGVLFFKNMPDKGTRVVFQNEMGFAFFDFEWSANDVFAVKQIIPQLNKPAVVKTLRKDLELLLLRNLDKTTETTFTDGTYTYERFTLQKGYAYYIENGKQLLRIENAGKKKVMSINLDGNARKTTLTDSIFIKHYKAHFTIDLKKIPPHAEE